MPTSFTYDVAISYVAEDSLTATHLMKRLQPRLHAPIFDAATVQDHDAHIAADILCSDARIVVVLHQRLWGETPSTQRDLSAIQQRLARDGAGFLVMVALEPAEKPPEWLTGTPVETTLSNDGVADVDAIAAAVESAGGSTQPAVIDDGEPVVGMPDIDDIDDDMGGRGAMLSSFKIANAAQREVAALMNGIEKGADEIRASYPDLKVEVRRAPDRCLLQAGDVGLSVSWLHRPVTSGEGALLVMEWDGTVTFPGEAARRGHASVAHEQVLHLETVAWPAWNWSVDDAPMRKYTSADLASLCIQLIIQRLRDSESAVGAATLFN